MLFKEKILEPPRQLLNRQMNAFQATAGHKYNVGNLLLMGAGIAQLGASTYLLGGTSAVAATVASGVFMWSGAQYKKGKYAIGDYASALGATVLTVALAHMSGGFDQFGQCAREVFSGHMPHVTLPAVNCASAFVGGLMHAGGKAFGFKSLPLLSRPFYLIAPALSMLQQPILAVGTFLATTCFAQADSHLKLSDNDGNPRPTEELTRLERGLKPFVIMPASVPT